MSNAASKQRIAQFLADLREQPEAIVELLDLLTDPTLRVRARGIDIPESIVLAPGKVVARPKHHFFSAEAYVTWLLEVADPYPINAAIAMRIDADHLLYGGSWCATHNDTNAYRKIFTWIKHGTVNGKNHPELARDVHVAHDVWATPENKARIDAGGTYTHLADVYPGK